MNLPSDDYILLSVINTKLRDCYSSFEELCEEEDVDWDDVSCRLFSIGYVYDKYRNAFVQE